MTSPKKITRIGIVIKHHHPEAADLACRMTEFLLSHGRHVIFATESDIITRGIIKAKKGQTALLRRIKVIEKKDMVNQTDLIIVMGGDGTYLSIARLMKNRSVPVLGINMGQLGFLTETKQSEAFDTVGRLLAGEIPIISERVLLEVTLRRKGKVIFQGPVVNDAVISKGAIARIIGMEVKVNGKLVNQVRADGIIVSTPTGSTAYSLAAGGPIMEPTVPALILTPICAHALTQRPLVVADHSVIEIRLNHRPGHVLLTLDGQDVVDMREDDVVTVQRFKKHRLELISSPTRDYFSLLREKLKFGSRDG